MMSEQAAQTGLQNGSVSQTGMVGLTTKYKEAIRLCQSGALEGFDW
jgi:hypothetical protein